MYNLEKTLKQLSTLDADTALTDVILHILSKVQIRLVTTCILH
jgi:hypothetical protein